MTPMDKQRLLLYLESESDDDILVLLWYLNKKRKRRRKKYLDARKTKGTENFCQNNLKMPIIYGIMPSPPSRAVILTAKLVGLDFTLKPLDFEAQENRSKEFLKKNPAHSIPVFEEDDGFTIFDSHAIVTYIVSKYGKDDSLYPKDLRARAVVDNMLHFNNSCIWPSITQHFTPTLMFGKPFDKEKEAVFLDRMTTLDAILGERPYAAGDHFTVADVCIINSLTGPAVAGFDSAAFPNILKWQEKLKKEMKFYDEIIVEGTEALRKQAEKYKAFLANQKKQ